MFVAKLRACAIKPYTYWLKKNWYYHGFIARLCRSFVPHAARILQVSCKNGFLLAAVNPSYGVGVDDDASCIDEARITYPSYHFYRGNLSAVPPQTFDYIIISLATMEVDDVQSLFEELHQFCHERTRIIVDFYSALWEPILWITQRISLRRTTMLKNWLSWHDVNNILMLANYEMITHHRYLLIPCYIPLISWIFNSLIAPLPYINLLCLSEWIIARPRTIKNNLLEYAVSIIIPCRNERGTIESAVQQCPQLGTYTEIIFVEGHSSDNTLEEVQRVQRIYPEKNVRWYVQRGSGKGDAVHLGCAHAMGDIIMIQDGDITVSPMELSKFFYALISGKGEFINGSRLVYGMECGAMRFLNLIANYFFGLQFSWLLGQPIKDTLCGTKVLFKNDYEKIMKNRAYFGDFDPFGDFDLLFGAAHLNLKIIDVPVHYKNRHYGTTQISRFRHGALLLYMSFIALKKIKFK